MKPYVGRQLTVIAWLWARTVKSPEPGLCKCRRTVDLHFHALHPRRAKEAYVEPVIENGGYRFAVEMGTPPEAAKTGTTAG